MTFGPNESVRVEVQERDPKCRGYCQGERFANEPPARYAHDTAGRKGIYCLCCGEWLRLSSLKDYGPDDSMARFGGQAEAVKVRLFECPRCLYDVKSAKELR